MLYKDIVTAHALLYVSSFNKAILLGKLSPSLLSVITTSENGGRCKME